MEDEIADGWLVTGHDPRIKSSTTVYIEDVTRDAAIAQAHEWSMTVTWCVAHRFTDGELRYADEQCVQEGTDETERISRAYADELAARGTRTCENCGRLIGKLESPQAWEGHRLCFDCKQRLENASVDTRRAARLLIVKQTADLVLFFYWGSIGLAAVVSVLVKGPLWTLDYVSRLPTYLAGIAIWLVIFSIPMLFLRRSRGYGGLVLFCYSHLLGTAMWVVCLCALADNWGTIGMFVGLALLGIGVIPVAIISMLFATQWLPVAIAGAACVVLVVCRFGGIAAVVSSMPDE